MGLGYDSLLHLLMQEELVEVCDLLLNGGLLREESHSSNSLGAITQRSEFIAIRVHYSYKSHHSDGGRYDGTPKNNIEVGSQ